MVYLVTRKKEEILINKKFINRITNVLSIAIVKDIF